MINPSTPEVWRWRPSLPRQREEALRRFFAGVTEYAFTARLGVADPPLVDYLVAMLVRFVRTDAVFGLRNPRGERLGQVADMLIEAEARQGPARRRVCRHIGDFTLFWSGVLPRGGREEPAQGPQGRPASTTPARASGTTCLASRLPADEDSAPGDVLERLSDRFELCVYGLGEVRKQWEEREGDAPLLLG